MRTLAPTRKIRILYHPDSHSLSPIDRSWEIRYQYTVPSRTPGAEWDPEHGVFFIWGDTDFDLYGPRNSTFRMHDYVYNQIVPQLVIGNALASNDERFNPGWITFGDWHVQAQYFWERLPLVPSDGAAASSFPGPRAGAWPSVPRRLTKPLPASGGGARLCEGNGSIACALCGDVVAVKPSDVITTTISYDGFGTMTASISAEGGNASTITIPRPFPNDPGMYANWKDFFHRAEARSGSYVGRGVLHSPDWNVEAGVEDGKTLCSICPLAISKQPVVTNSEPQLTWSVGAENGPPGSKWHADCMKTCLSTPRPR